MDYVFCILLNMYTAEICDFFSSHLYGKIERLYWCTCVYITIAPYAAHVIRVTVRLYAFSVSLYRHMDKGMLCAQMYSILFRCCCFGCCCCCYCYCLLSLYFYFIFARASKILVMCAIQQQQKSSTYHTYSSVSGRDTCDVDSFQSRMKLSSMRTAFVYVCVCVSECVFMRARTQTLGRKKSVPKNLHMCLDFLHIMPMTIQDNGPESNEWDMRCFNY